MPGGADDGGDGRSRGVAVLTADLPGRVAAVLRRIATAAHAAGRAPADVTLLAASKTRSPDAIRAARDAGVQCFGENYVQELVTKSEAVPDVAWHFIGHLQRNKARQLQGRVAMIHTLDSIRLADTLAGWDTPVDVLLQVNVAQEQSKAGCGVEEAGPLLSHVLSHCARLRPRGLMTIPPADEPPEPHFRALADLRAHLERSFGHPLPHLSMGMSHDLEVAVACGATLVRIGTALFGPR